MLCQFFAQKCSNCQEKPKYQNSWGPPEHSAIGNIIYYIRDILLVIVITLQTVIQKQLPVGLNGVFLMVWSHILKIEKNFYQIYPNSLVALNLKCYVCFYIRSMRTIFTARMQVQPGMAHGMGEHSFLKGEASTSIHTDEWMEKLF